MNDWNIRIVSNAFSLRVSKIGCIQPLSVPRISSKVYSRGVYVDMYLCGSSREGGGSGDVAPG